MKFELGKTYIVEVTENGIIPTEEFDESRWYDKDHDDLDFLTDEEKAVVMVNILEDVKKKITYQYRVILMNTNEYMIKLQDTLDTIDKEIRELKGEEDEKNDSTGIND